MFETFRRHQKKWLAALTIMAMFAFSFPAFFQFGDDKRRREDPVVAEIDGQKVTRSDLRGEGDEREIANVFVAESLAAVHGDQRSLMFLAALGHPVARRLPDYFGPSRDAESLKDGIRQMHKADALGLTFSDDMVRDWITRITDNKLSTEQFRAVVGTLSKRFQGLTQDTLFGVLRRQLRTEQLRDVTFGRFGEAAALVTPYEAWQFHRKLNDKVALEIIPVSVSDFADQIADPGVFALRELYDQYADRLPDPTSPEPGFKEPHKVRLQYAFASVEAFWQALKPEVSDAEIEKYYDSHKELYRVMPSRSAGELQPGTEMEPVGPAELPEKPKLDSAKPDEGDADEKPSSKEKDQPDADPQEGSPETADESSEAPLKPQAPDQQDAAKTDQERPAQEPAAKQPAEKDAEAAEKMDSDTDQSNDAEAPQETKEEPKYKPLEEVAEEIRERLSRNKTRDEILDGMKQVKEVVYKFGDTYLEAEMNFEDAKKKQPDLQFQPPDATDFSGEVEEVTRKLGLSFSQTDRLSVEELSKLETIGASREGWSERSLGRLITDVVTDAKMYDPREFKTFDKNHFAIWREISPQDYFLVWKTADQPAQAPPFEEIRENVLAAYRTTHARKLAETRAGELAKLVRQHEGSIAELREKYPEIESHSIAALTLWSSRAQLDFDRPAEQGEVVPTDLTNVRLPGDALRNLAFTLKEGEVGVAPNQPEDTYYVILVSQHEQSSYEDFARSRPMIERQLSVRRLQELRTDWLNDLREASARGKLKSPSAN